MTTDRSGNSGPPRDDPYCDIASLVIAMYGELTRAAFRSLGNHHDAEDAVQDACVKVLRCWPRVGSLATAAQQRAYLFRVVINETLQIRRRPYRRQECLGGVAAEGEGVLEYPHERRQAASDHLQLVWKAIGELPERCREVVVLFAAGYEYQEIAAMLDMPASTVRGHISRARQQLPRPGPDFWEEGRQ